MFQIGNQVLVANNMGNKIARKADVLQVAKLYHGRVLECAEGNIYRFPNDSEAKEFYNWLNDLVCNTKDEWIPHNGFQY